MNITAPMPSCERHAIRQHSDAMCIISVTRDFCGGCAPTFPHRLLPFHIPLPSIVPDQPIPLIAPSPSIPAFPHRIPSPFRARFLFRIPVHCLSPARPCDRNCIVALSPLSIRFALRGNSLILIPRFLYHRYTRTDGHLSCIWRIFISSRSFVLFRLRTIPTWLFSLYRYDTYLTLMSYNGLDISGLRRWWMVYFSLEVNITVTIRRCGVPHALLSRHGCLAMVGDRFHLGLGHSISEVRDKMAIGLAFGMAVEVFVVRARWAREYETEAGQLFLILAQTSLVVYCMVFGFTISQLGGRF
ncbi:hypothetical protein B0J18DRAFT_297849 [Chaetomium sp. MPI-SDFR-AT-0129]|nr:hypothetical protein B0J18DRAFT_297849 [Chaetomium sp. MPI-SDFR-AT-0129]